MQVARRRFGAVWMTVLGGMLLAAAVVAVHWLYGSRSSMSRAEPRFFQAGWAQLDGWARDSVHEALPAFLRSCAAWAELPGGQPVGGEKAVYGTVADWRGVCARAR
ncbi:MAG: hypothetical protein ACLFWF_04265, partial [Alphaproteobacteria bacterium]